MNHPLLTWLPEFGQDPDSAPPREFLADLVPVKSATDDEALWQQRVDQAYQRGLAEARAEAEVAFAQERDDLQTVHAEACATLRADLETTYGAQFGRDLVNALSQLEYRLADSIARVLGGLVNDAVMSEILDGFSKALTRLMQGGDAAALVVRGPQHLLDRLADEMGEDLAAVRLEPGNGIELVATLATTVIETQFEDWKTQIEASVQGAKEPV